MSEFEKMGMLSREKIIEAVDAFEHNSENVWGYEIALAVSRALVNIPSKVLRRKWAIPRLDQTEKDILKEHLKVIISDEYEDLPPTEKARLRKEVTPLLVRAVYYVGDFKDGKILG